MAIQVTATDVDAIKVAILDLKGSIKAMNQQAFNIFEQSLAAPLQVQFRTIVVEQCSSSDYVTLEGTRASEPRGRILESFWTVVICWLGLFGPEGEAETTLCLIQNHILTNLDLISVKAGVHQFKMLNKLLP